jgi:beta-glucosidase
LPLRRGAKILVVGKSADSLRNQAGGWTLDWQGMKNRNADFPAGDTILAGIREAAGEANVVFDETAAKADVAGFDAVIAVIGELPYAEMKGDIVAPASLAAGERFPEDLQALRRVAGRGKPVITVFVAGRPLYTNDLMNLSDAFVAAWLPGTEGKGVADVLFRDARGAIAYDFHGTLALRWPRSPDQAAFAKNDGEPLFALGYGLTYANPRPLGTLAGEQGRGARGMLVIPAQAGIQPLLAMLSTKQKTGQELDDARRFPDQAASTSMPSQSRLRGNDEHAPWPLALSPAP